MPEDAGGAALVRQRRRAIVSLQGRLWRDAARNNPSVVVMGLLVALYALGATMMAAAWIWQRATLGELGPLVVMCGVAMLAYLGLVVMMPSSEGRLLPQTYAAFPLPVEQVLGPAALCSLMQVKAILATTCTLIVTVVASAGLAAGGRGIWIVPLVIGMALNLAVTIAAGEVLAGALGAAASPRSKQRNTILASLMTGVVFLGYYLFTSGLLDLGTFDEQWLGVTLTGWTLAAGPGAAAGFATGDWLAGLARLLIAAVTLAGLVWLWRRQLASGLMEPLPAAVAPKRVVTGRGKRPPVLLPGLAWDAGPMIFSRAVRYLVRDSRLLGTLVVYPVFGVYVALVGREQPFMVFFGLYFFAVLPALVGGNDFGYDGPSNWLHLSSNINPRTLLVARHGSSLLLGAVLMTFYLVLVWFTYPHPAVVGISAAAAAGTLLSASGVAMLATTHNPFPMSKPGTNPWADRSGFSSAAFLTSLAAMFACWLPVLPGVIVAWFGHTRGASAMTAAGCLLALGVPLAVQRFAVRISAAKLARSYPEIFERVRRYA